MMVDVHTRLPRTMIFSAIQARQHLPLARQERMQCQANGSILKRHIQTISALKISKFTAVHGTIWLVRDPRKNAGIVEITSHTLAA